MYKTGTAAPLDLKTPKLNQLIFIRCVHIHIYIAFDFMYFDCINAKTGVSQKKVKNNVAA